MNVNSKLMDRSMTVGRWSASSWAIVLFLAVSPFLLVFLRPEGSIALHTNMETAATILALVVGLTALARYRAAPDFFTLMLGAGFLGAAFLDGYHAVVSTAAISPYLPSSMPALVPWSWVASRFFLGVLVLASCVMARRAAGKPVSRSAQRGVFLSVAGMAVFSFLFFAFAPLPRAYYPELWIHRPEELIPGVLFLGAFLYALKHSYWHAGALKRWLCIFLVLSIVTQFLVMPFSLAVFDGPFDIAHLMKSSSYIAVFVGLLTNIYEVFLERDRSARSLLEKARMLQIKSEEADQARLDAENALKAKSEFLAVMSHEIRTPLNGVLGMSDLLRQSNLEKSQREILQYIRESGAALNTIINDILDFSKLEAGKIRLEEIGVSLRQLAASCVGLLHSRAEEKGLSVVVDVDDEIPDAVLVDPTRLRQILLNLLSNAIKFTDSGAVTVRLQHRGAHSGLHRIAFSVSDTGMGLSERQMKKLFAKFEQADASVSRKFGGSGLGLSIVKQLIHLMGTDISVKSEEGQGTVFSFALLLEEASELHPSQRQDVEGAFIAIKPLRILIVDDNLVNRTVLSMMLEKLGHTTQQFDNAQDFLDQIDRINPDLTLLDIRMPTLDGLTAIRMLRDRESGAGRHMVVACSADVISDFRDDETLRNKFDGFLPKPVRLPDLIGCVDRVLGAACHSLVEDGAADGHRETGDTVRKAEVDSNGLKALDDLLKELS